MSQFRKIPDGTIDYDFYKKEAGQLRREARDRSVSLVIRAICFPFRLIGRFARAWQLAWPSPPVTTGSRAGFSLAKVRSLFW
jgi:hypothetical protein